MLPAPFDILRGFLKDIRCGVIGTPPQSPPSVKGLEFLLGRCCAGKCSALSFLFLITPLVMFFHHKRDSHTTKKQCLEVRGLCLLTGMSCGES